MTNTVQVDFDDARSAWEDPDVQAVLHAAREAVHDSRRIELPATPLTIPEPPARM